MIDWLDKRFFIRDTLTKPSLPRGRASWQYFVGFMAFLLMITQLFTGIWLTLDFSFVGSIKENTSIIFKFHHVGAHLLLVFMILQIMRNLLVGSYQRPREFHWLTLFSIFMLTCLNYYVAVLLRSQIGEHVYSVINWLHNFSFLSIHYLPINGQMTLQKTKNVFVLHALIIPLVTYTLFWFYLWLLQRTGLESRSKD